MLLFDQHLSSRLLTRLADIYPGSAHLRLAGLARSPDSLIWDHAKTHRLNIVTKDAEFGELSLLRGSPPKVMWLRMGNSATTLVEACLRSNFGMIQGWMNDPDSALVELY